MEMERGRGVEKTAGMMGVVGRTGRLKRIVGGKEGADGFEMGGRYTNAVGWASEDQAERRRLGAEVVTANGSVVGEWV